MHLTRSFNYTTILYICDIGCTSSIDIVFVLDASGSVRSNNFVTMKNFVKNVASNFDIGDNRTHVGIIRYSDNNANLTSIILSLGSINNTNELNTFIDNITYTGGKTATHSALNLLPTAFNTSRTDQGIPRVAIVFTDGQSNNPTLTAQAAQSVHASTGIIVYSIGIGNNVDENELNTIASSSSNVFLISSFSAGDFAALLLPLRTTACTSKSVVLCIVRTELYITAPSSTTIGSTIDANLQMSEARLLQYAFPSEGLTLVIDVTQGQIQVYGSFSIPNPTVLTADFYIPNISKRIDHFISFQLYLSSTGNTSSVVDVYAYISITGLQGSNSFSLNTTLGITG